MLLQNKRVADLIDIEKDLLSHGVTAIYAGVGAGKNTFVEGYHQDGVDYPGLSEKYKVLLITSRKAKVLETKANTDNFLSDLRKFPNISAEEIQKIDKSIVCTNAHIQRIIEHEYSNMTHEKNFWERFDFVIVDEFHSLVTDATFAASSYHVRWLLDKIKEKNIDSAAKTKPRIILMSGTPEPAADIVQSLSANVLDYRKTAVNVKPKQIAFQYYQTAMKNMLTVLKKGQRVVYFMCGFQNLKDLIESALDAGLSQNQIAVSVSDDKTNKGLEEKYPEIYANKEQTEEELIQHGQIPENVLFFITNSKNKEGINIKSDVPLLVMENHYTVDIQQICGRIRNGQHQCIIIIDAGQFVLECEYSKEEEYWRNHGLRSANDHLKEIAKACGFQKNDDAGWYEEIMEFRRYIESRTKYVRFNPFRNQFDMNECYIQARKYYHYKVNQLESYVEAMLIYGDSRESLWDIDDYFRDIPVYLEDVTQPEKYIETYFKEHGYVFGETRLTKEQKQQLFEDLQGFAKNHPLLNKKPSGQFGRLLGYFGCSQEEVGRTEYGNIVVSRK